MIHPPPAEHLLATVTNHQPTRAQIDTSHSSERGWSRAYTSASNSAVSLHTCFSRTTLRNVPLRAPPHLPLEPSACNQSHQVRPPTYGWHVWRRVGQRHARPGEMSTPTPGQPSAPTCPMRGGGGGSRTPPPRTRRCRIPVGTAGAPPPASSSPPDAPVTRSPVLPGRPNATPTSSPLGQAYRGRQVHVDMAARRRWDAVAADAMPEAGTEPTAPSPPTSSTVAAGDTANVTVTAVTTPQRHHHTHRHHYTNVTANAITTRRHHRHRQRWRWTMPAGTAAARWPPTASVGAAAQRCASAETGDRRGGRHRGGVGKQPARGPATTETPANSLENNQADAASSIDAADTAFTKSRSTGNPITRVCSRTGGPSSKAPKCRRAR